MQVEAEPAARLVNAILSMSAATKRRSKVTPLSNESKADAKGTSYISRFNFQKRGGLLGNKNLACGGKGFELRIDGELVLLRQIKRQGSHRFPIYKNRKRSDFSAILNKEGNEPTASSTTLVTSSGKTTVTDALFASP